jgi:hypothetical protein
MQSWSGRQRVPVVSFEKPFSQIKRIADLLKIGVVSAV